MTRLSRLLRSLARPIALCLFAGSCCADCGSAAALSLRRGNAAHAHSCTLALSLHCQCIGSLSQLRSLCLALPACCCILALTRTICAPIVTALVCVSLSRIHAQLARRSLSLSRLVWPLSRAVIDTLSSSGGSSSSRLARQLCISFARLLCCSALQLRRLRQRCLTFYAITCNFILHRICAFVFTVAPAHTQ